MASCCFSACHLLKALTKKSITETIDGTSIVKLFPNYHVTYPPLKAPTGFFGGSGLLCSSNNLLVFWKLLRCSLIRGDNRAKAAVRIARVMRVLEAIWP